MDRRYTYFEEVLNSRSQFIRQTYTYASDSLAINGLEFDSTSVASAGASKSRSTVENTDTPSFPFPFPSALTTPHETVEYEPYDGKLAARVSSLYAQLESLTTTVAQLRRDAPRKAAKMYAANLRRTIDEEDQEFEQEQQQRQNRYKRRRIDRQKDTGNDDENLNGDGDDLQEANENQSQNADNVDPEWKLDISLGTQAERERWRSGEMAEIYTDTLRTLLRLQREEEEEEEEQIGHRHSSNAMLDSDKKAISTTVATAERAEKAAKVVERMVS